jgi:hypothetical protein
MLLTLLGLWMLAFWTRLQFIHLYGGCESSYIEWARANYFGGISEFYLQTATALQRGEGYVALVYPPGYPMFLAALSRAGLADVAQMRVAQAALDATATWAVYVLVRRTGLARGWAMAGAATYAVLPLWAAGAVFVLAESLSQSLLLWVLVLVLALGAGRSWRPWIPGAALGIATLVRPDLMLLVIPCAAWVVWDRGWEQAMRPVVSMAAGFAIVVGAWGIHNLRVHGSSIVGTTNSGAGLWEGLGELPNDYGYVLDDQVAARRVFAARGYLWASIEANQYFTREYFQAWVDHPWFVVRVIAARMPRILFESERLQPLFFGRARQALDAFGLALVLAATWLRRWHAPSVFLLCILPLYALGSIGMVHYEARYVRYVEVSYIIGVLIVTSALWTAFRMKSPRGALVAAGLLVLIVSGYTGRELHSIRSAASSCVNRGPTEPRVVSAEKNEEQ